MKCLAGKIAIVTGAGQGIGEAVARRFAAEGGRIVSAEGDPERGEGVAASLREIGAEAMAIRTDVADAASVDVMVATADAFGMLDVLVNNAGIGSRPAGAAHCRHAGLRRGPLHRRRQYRRRRRRHHPHVRIGRET